MVRHNRANAPSRLAFIVTLMTAAGLTMPAGVMAQQTAASELAKKTEEVRRKHDVPALVVALVNEEGLVEAQCAGYRKRDTSDKVELTDRFAIGSNTKSMTATLAAVLVEAGKIEWSTTIGDVWPKATDEHIHPKLKSVTLDELLSHQSGLKSDISGKPWVSFFEEKNSPVLERRRMLRLVLSKSPSETQRKFSYSNLGYVVAAAMLETRAEEAYESLMKRHVFAPLQMRSADFRSMESARKMKPPMVWGHESNGAPKDPRVAGAENPTVYAACGTVNLSIEDYAKYARWHLAGDPQPVLQSKATFDHLHEPLVDRSPGSQYACGWICAPTQLGPGLNHGGSNTHSVALIWVVPESNFAAIAFANTGESQAFPACHEIIDYLMQAQTPDPGEVDPERLVGRYQLHPSFIFDVNYEDGHMMVGITNQETQEVFADSPTRWSYRAVDATLEFHVRSKGPAYALTLHQNGAAQRATRVRK